MARARPTRAAVAPAHPPIEYLIAYRERHLAAAADLASWRIMELGTAYHRIRTRADLEALNRTHDRIAAAVAKLIDVEVSYRQRETDRTRRAYARAGQALAAAGADVPEWAGVELAAYVEQARQTRDPERLAVIDAHIARHVDALVGRHASRFGAHYRREQQRPARQRRAAKMNRTRRTQRPARAGEARARALALLLDGFTQGETLDAVVSEYGWARDYARQAIGGIRALAKAAKRR